MSAMYVKHIRRISRLIRQIKWRIDERLLLIIVGSIVGCCGGVAGVVLNTILSLVSHTLHSMRSHWASFLLPALGAGMSAFFLGHILKEGAGHGVPEVIYSVTKRSGLLRLRSSYSRLISSTLTIATGGSAGPEAPVVMSGASIGSNIAKKAGLNDRQRIVVVGCGAASAIASIFNAPIAGMIFGVEVILGEWANVNLIPIAIASAMGAEVSRIFEGNQIPFEHQPFVAGPVDIMACVALGLLAGVGSVVFTRLLSGAAKKSKALVSSDCTRAALGGACVGLLGLYWPFVLGEGYEVVRTIIENNFQSGLVLVLVATAAKALATSITIGSGGSGGIFAPCLVIGGLGGLSFHRVLTFIWPTLPLGEEGLFSLLGMSAVLSGVLQAPLTGIFLIVEITGSYGVILPLILVSAISAILAHYLEPVSFYHRELAVEGRLLRPRTDESLLADLNVSELVEKDPVVVREDMCLGEIIPLIKNTTQYNFPVENGNGEYLGLIRFDEIRPYLFNPGLQQAVILGELIHLEKVSISPFDDLKIVLKKMEQTQSSALPVVHRNKVYGMITKEAILDRYRKELAVQSY